MSKLNVAVVGATGMVGEKIREILNERFDHIDQLYLFASKRSAGTAIDFKGKTIIVEELTETAFDGKKIDYMLFSAGGTISEKYAPIAISKGIVVIDNSSFWRMDSTVPLVVPEVNAEILSLETKLIANPNCSTIQAMLPLKCIDDMYGLKRIVYTTFQAVSGAGVAGVKDLEEGTCDNFSKPIARNVLPQIDVFTDNGYTKEELKMIDETKKILGKPDLAVTATAVRVPIKNTHAISINVECERTVDLLELETALMNYPGIKVIDAPDYPIAESVDGTDDVYVGRLRHDYSRDNTINLWVVADNIRKGAATNTVQIMESMIKLKETH